MPHPAAQIGRYQLLERLGAGGMGEVWRALDPHLQRHVALKIIRPSVLDEPLMAKRFAMEARALAAVADPHVVRLYDCDPSPHQPWLVMELIDGVTLREVIRVGHPMGLAEWQRCAREISAALAAIHHAGMIHRDVKPENIMRRQRSGSCVLLDLGLAHDSDQTAITQPGAVMGTVRYLAPERIKGGPLQPGSDCWALGITLLELAQGAVLHKGLESHAIAHRITSEGAPDLGLLRDDIPAPWLAWWRDLVHPDPRSRIPDGVAALARLQDLDKPVAVVDQPSVTALAPTEVIAGEWGTDAQSAAASAGPVTAARTLRPQQAQQSSLPLAGQAPSKRSKRGRFVYKLVLALWLLSTLAALVTAVGLSRTAIADQKERLRQMVASAASSAALGIDGEDHQHLVALGSAASADPRFAQMAEYLAAFRRQWPRVRYIYTMTRLAESDETGVVAFVVDASDEIDINGNGVIDPDEMIAEPATRYAASAMPRLLEGFTQSAADDEPITDQWGTWLSGYAPIRFADGRPAGSLVGIDVPVEHLQAMRRDFLLQAAILVGSSLLAFIAAGWLLAHRLRRPVLALHRGMIALAEGDLEATVSIHSGDEFEDLAEAFESMRQGLQAANRLRLAYERHVARTLGFQAAQQAGLPGAEDALWLVLRLRLAQDDSQATVDRAIGLLISTVHDHGAVIEGIWGSVIKASFQPTHPQDQPINRALLCALALRDPGAAWPQPAGVSLISGQSADKLMEWEISRHHLADIVLDEASYQLARERVVVDVLVLPHGESAYALKALM